MLITNFTDINFVNGTGPLGTTFMEGQTVYPETPGSSLVSVAIVTSIIPSNVTGY